MDSQTANTSDRLIRYLYHELPGAERRAFEEELFGSRNRQAEATREFFFELVDLKTQLDRTTFGPSQRTTERIMRFAKAANQEPLEPLPIAQQDG